MNIIRSLFSYSLETKVVNDHKQILTSNWFSLENFPSNSTTLVNNSSPTSARPVDKRKFRYAGHVIRGSSGHLLRLALEDRIEGRRGRGRHLKNWTDDTKQ
ncbi:UDP-glucuronosyltransferase 2A1-like [Elysia marginata]|uniref:UDP-glucuronosyltransferase 2A1-like n=1 Tax=Elysia marginata TaxID=1093978 RepID=A0AAV4GRN2_9GAST|nr:UDP-glucuronosyltransferase 2A1-like [Elysia marginata]